MGLINKISLKVALWLIKHGYGRLGLVAGSYDETNTNFFDVNTGATYFKEDYPVMEKYFKSIREASNDKITKSKLIDRYQYHIWRKWNDHHIPRDDKLAECDKAVVQIDRVVFDGLERQAQLITGKNQRYMTHYAIAAGTNVTTSQVKPSETKLDDEVARLPMHFNGFADAKGSSIAFGILYNVNVPTTLITNSGVTDGPVETSTIIYLRTNYIGSNRVQITFGQTLGAFTSIVYQRSA